MLQYGLTKRNGIATSMTAHDFLKLPASHSFLQQPLVIKEEGWDTLIVPDGAAALAALQKRFDLRFSLPCSPVRAGTQSRGQSEPDALLVQKYVADPLLLLGGCVLSGVASAVFSFSFGILGLETIFILVWHLRPYIP